MNSSRLALEYHAAGRPGKISIQPTKPFATADDLSLAYTPGVAEPVREIARDPTKVYAYTNKGNLVACVTDGSAVLGLGAVGALAGKPVMEGKAVLFKRFADIDVFDIEVSAPSTEAFIETVVIIAPTFGGINLEDIAAPQCFAIEQALRERLEIPVFHDDQHGTAVISCAGLINALELQGKLLEEVEIVIIGAGAAGIATTKLLYRLGVPRSSILLVDSVGVIYSGRDGLNVYKEACAIDTPKRTLAEALVSADVVIGVSGPNLINKAMIRTMARRAIVFALSNPDPEILPTEALAANPNIIMATGRSDFPNQVNNSLVFPFLFRGVLNAGAQQIDDKVLVAAMHALAGLAREPVPDAVLAAYQVDKLEFGPGYILPTQFDPRLYDTLVPAIEAAVDKDQHKGESQSRAKSAK